MKPQLVVLFFLTVTVVLTAASVVGIFVLLLHDLEDYLDAKKLHQITNETTVVRSLFQATGSAASLVGYLNRTIHKDGRVVLSAEDVKAVEEKLQISQPLSSLEAEVPQRSQSQVDVISWLPSLGCEAFADLVRSNSKALTTFEDKFNGGLTIFCPTDDAVNSFMPIYKNLTEDKRVSLLLYHGIPVFFQWPPTTGVVKTLAATEEGANNKYAFTVQNYRGDVIFDTRVNNATVVKTLIYEVPFALYRISNVLLPRELFKDDGTAPAESPKPAEKKKDEAPAESPKPTKKKKGSDAPADSEVVFQEGDCDDRPGPGSDSEADGQKGAYDDNGVIGFNNGYSFIMVFFSLVIRVLVL